MKLQTTIVPRTDGTVRVRGADNAEFVFRRNAEGDLECDVRDLALVKRLLMTEDFYPVDDADFRAAATLTLKDPSIPGGDDLDDDDPDDGLEDDQDETADLNALPIEGAAAGGPLPGDLSTVDQQDEDAHPPGPSAQQLGAVAAGEVVSRRRRHR